MVTHGLSFSSEIVLQQAIAGLLSRMPNVSGVQVLQGSLELGKDIVFCMVGPLDDKIYCACVIKNRRLSGAVDATGARTVLIQAQQAFDSPFYDGEGVAINVHRVYVITPFNIPPTTIESIRGALSNRPGQVTFIGGEKLFDLFRTYWPDFLFDEANALEAMLLSTKNAVSESDATTHLASQHGLHYKVSDGKRIYVTQQFERPLHYAVMGSSLASFPPDERAINRKWSIQDLEATKCASRHLESVLHDLSVWKLIGDIENVVRALRNAAASIEDAWFSGLPESLSTLGRKNPKRVPKELEQPLNQKLLEEPVLNCKTELKRVLEPLKSLLDSNNALVTARPSMSDISNSRLWEAARLSDCANALPRDVLSVKESYVLPLSSTVIKECKEHLMIVGAPGFGKTTFCRFEALRDVEGFETGRSSYFPIYIPLHTLANVPLSSFDAIYDRNKHVTALLSEDSRERLVDSIPLLRIYLDGLDEIPSPDQRVKLIKLLSLHASTHQNIQFIMTARDFIYHPSLDWMKRLWLRGFDEQELDVFVEKWLHDKPGGKSEFMSQLRSLPRLRELIAVPLIATLTVLLFRQTGFLPESKLRLYENFVTTLSGGWDLAKGVLREAQFDQRVKLLALTALASHLHERDLKEISEQDACKVLTERLGRSIVEQWDQLRSELLTDGLICKVGNKLLFSHLSFQEFFVAKDYSVDVEAKRIRKALQKLIQGDNWWKEVVLFYVSMTTRPKELVLWLMRELNVASGETAVQQIFQQFRESFPGFPIEDYVDIPSE